MPPGESLHLGNPGVVERTKGAKRIQRPPMVVHTFGLSTLLYCFIPLVCQHCTASALRKEIPGQEGSLLHPSASFITCALSFRIRILIRLIKTLLIFVAKAKSKICYSFDLLRSSLYVARISLIEKCGRTY